MSKQLQATIDAAWEARDGINSATRGEVRDAVEAALDAYHPDAIDPDDHKADLTALEDAEGKVYDLTERVSELERELEDERDTVARLQARIAELEEDLDAPADAKTL